VFEALKMDVYRVSQKEREEAVDLFATQFWESKDATKDRVLWAKGDFLSLTAIASETTLCTFTCSQL
jgi:hypothetical protein